MSYFIDALRRCFEFSGRSSRAAYWYYVLWVLIIQSLALLLDFSINSRDPFLYLIGACIFAIPSVSVAVRRLHDTDRSGFWVLISLVPVFGLVLLVFLIEPSTEGSNRFGPSPHDEQQLVVAQSRWSAFQTESALEPAAVPHWEYRKKVAAGGNGQEKAAATSTVALAVQPKLDSIDHDLLAKLERIAALRQSGALTQDEFELLKRRTLQG